MNEILLITGASGFVGSAFNNTYRKTAYKKFTIDAIGDDTVTLKLDLRDLRKNHLADLAKSKVTVVNFAAARQDIDTDASEYYENNVSAHQNLLRCLSNFQVVKFIHLCSVAAIDGEKIIYTEELECDDAYRVTKFLQQQAIADWCKKENIPFIRILPSAIFSADHRDDTNIGTLQKIAKKIPFIPIISTKKSLTYLPNLCLFIARCIESKDLSGSYLAIERPVLSVSQILVYLSGEKKRVVLVPGMRLFLNISALFFDFFSNIMKKDLKLRPSRIVKLYSDTSYNGIENSGIDTEQYSVITGSRLLPSILKSLKEREAKG